MGSFVFKWEHPASEVYVTGTFDDWSKSEKLIKTGDVFAKNVTLPSADEKIYYKFVVDDNWVTDHTAPQENDASGNLNNFLTPDRIIKHTPETVGIMSGVTPTSTTAALAKDVPLQNAAATDKADLTESDLPGAFPPTPAATEKGDFSVNPLPATAGAGNPIKLAPGEKVPDPSTFTQNTVASGVRDDPELVAIEQENLKKATDTEPTFSVAPLPAFPGAVNPIKLAPGEKVPDPSTLTQNTVASGVRDDPELVAIEQENLKKAADTEPTFGVAPLPAFPGAVNPIKLAPGEKVPDPASLTQNTVTSGVHDDPELVAIEKAAKAGTIQSAGPDSTTAQLAAAVPLESSKVPDVVKKSQEEAGFPAEASAVPEEVAEKGAVEKELLSEVPPAKPTSEGAVKDADKPETISPAEKVAAAAGGAAAAGAAAVAAIIAHDTTASSTAKDTPKVVKESIAESGQSPEAASNEEAVLEKKATEKELLSEIKPETSTGESAPVIAPVLATGSTAKDTPEVVKESIAESGRSPEAASNEEAVLEKKAVEKELLSEVKPETSTGEPAPKVTSATTGGLNAPAAAAVAGKPTQSREVSPGTVPGTHPQTQTAPVATDGIVNTTTDKTSAATPAKKAETPAAAAAASPPGSSKASESPASSAAADKKKKRTSIFGRLKAKFSDKIKN
ncbi:uncharacterized protein BP5553_05381 [Venustampulla echinocandica]|uniref:AMP-activated protein kinase glycogen-binding domain-containing protein n=1 Tax=Venustampulla echinocandica TaxID=2656787 RepID=A0A370TR10_9HELO|nr:uncharacterized protein BP5553_05381 [Venustampulla echinocandica]RDL37948.1 hypothetical protein BP5553_05381 [Venustampulla echinocandica]